MTVRQVLKGPADLTAVTVRRNAGELRIDGAPVTAHERGFPAFAVGERYVLFLMSYDGAYDVVHGAEGGFRVTDGKVRQVLNGKWNEEHGDMPVEEFCAVVKSTVK